MSRRGEWREAFAVVRADRVADDGSAESPDSSGPEINLGEYSITIKEVVLRVEVAEAEVERLNSLNRGKGCRYYWQRTHYFPNGGSFGAGEMEP